METLMSLGAVVVIVVGIIVWVDIETSAISNRTTIIGKISKRLLAKKGKRNGRN